MKKITLSLLLTIGALSNIAFAKNLSVIMRNTTLTGNIQLEGYADSNKIYKRMYETKARFKFLFPVNENMRLVYGLDTYGIVYNNNDNNNIDSPLDNTLLYFNGMENNLIYNIGKIEVKTPVTGSGVGEAHGTGLITGLRINKNNTLIFGFVDNIKDLDQIPGNKTSNNIKIGAIVLQNQYNEFQTWYFNVKNLINNEYVVNYKYKYISGYGKTATQFRIIYAFSNITNKLKNTAGVSSNKQRYFNIDVSYKSGQTYEKLGYAKTYSGGGIVTLDNFSPIAKIFPAEQKTGITNTSDNTAYYLGLGYQQNYKLKYLLGYTNIIDKSSNNNDSKEYLLETNYKYSQKLNIKVYFSYLLNSKINSNKEFYIGTNYKF